MLYINCISIKLEKKEKLIKLLRIVYKVKKKKKRKLRTQLQDNSKRKNDDRTDGKGMIRNFKRKLEESDVLEVRMESSLRKQG